MSYRIDFAGIIRNNAPRVMAFVRKDLQFSLNINKFSFTIICQKLSYFWTVQLSDTNRLDYIIKHKTVNIRSVLP